METNSTRLGFTINIVAADRVGIVADVATVVLLHSGNILETVGRRIGASFVLAMRVDLPAGEATVMERHLALMAETSGCAISIFPTPTDVQSPDIQTWAITVH